MNQDPDPTPYYALTPDTVIDAVESTGRISDYRIIALNSFENRVYQVGIEDSTPIIAKFYRPGRWSDGQILEEHQFTLELAAAELPVVAPVVDSAGHSLYSWADFRIALYPRVGGHAPELDNLDTIYRLGQLLGQLHNIGARQPFAQRWALCPQRMGHASAALVLQQFVPAELQPAYQSLAEDLLRHIDSLWQSVNRNEFIRLHGDCHPGNILWRDDSATLVDFDDAINGPEIQDLWMLLSGDRATQLSQLAELVEGYEMFRPFPHSQLKLIEALRTLRMMHHAAWLARRWQDPTFKLNFPWFNSPRYWSDHILQLREQLAALQEQPLSLW